MSTGRLYLPKDSLIERLCNIFFKKFQPENSPTSEAELEKKFDRFIGMLSFMDVNSSDLCTVIEELN